MSVFYTMNLERNIKFRENTYWGEQETYYDVLYYTEMQTYMSDEITLYWALGRDEPVRSTRDLRGGKVGTCMFVSSIITSRVCFAFTNYKLYSESFEHKNKRQMEI